MKIPTQTCSDIVPCPAFASVEPDGMYLACPFVLLASACSPPWSTLTSCCRDPGWVPLQGAQLPGVRDPLPGGAPAGPPPPSVAYPPRRRHHRVSLRVRRQHGALPLHRLLHTAAVWSVSPPFPPTRHALFPIHRLPCFSEYSTPRACTTPWMESLYLPFLCSVQCMCRELSSQHRHGITS